MTDPSEVARVVGEERFYDPWVLDGTCNLSDYDSYCYEHRCWHAPSAIQMKRTDRRVAKARAELDRLEEDLDG